MKELVKQAIKARENAYNPYSNFAVGAALLLNNGEVIYGSNIENVSFGLSNCAERSALFSSYSQGYKKEDIKAMAIVADTKGVVSPCGACRQVMKELLADDTPIYLANLKGDIKEVRIVDLLPNSFDEIEIWAKKELGL